MVHAERFSDVVFSIVAGVSSIVLIITFAIQLWLESKPTTSGLCSDAPPPDGTPAHGQAHGSNNRPSGGDAYVVKVNARNSVVGAAAAASPPAPVRARTGTTPVITAAPTPTTRISPTDNKQSNTNTLTPGTPLAGTATPTHVYPDTGSPADPTAAASTPLLSAPHAPMPGSGGTSTPVLAPLNEDDPTPIPTTAANAPLSPTIRQNTVVTVKPSTRVAAAAVATPVSVHHTAPAPAPSSSTAIVGKRRVDVYSLFYWLHRLGFTMAIEHLIGAIDPLGIYGIYPFWFGAFVTNVEVFEIQMSISIWVRFTVALLYRQAQREMPGWVTGALVAAPCVYIICIVFLYYLPLYVTNLAIWTIGGDVLLITNCLVYSIVIPWMYHRVSAVLSRFVADVEQTSHAAAGAAAGGRAQFDTSYITTALSSLRRFVLVDFLANVTTIIVMSAQLFRDRVPAAINDPNKPRPPDRTELDGLAYGLTFIVHLISYVLLWYSWTPVSPVSRRKVGAHVKPEDDDQTKIDTKTNHH